MASIALPSMVTARPPSPPGSAPPRGKGPGAAVRPGWDWRVWWVVGLCFGLGYGVSHRLLNLDIEEENGASQRFDVQPFPGTSLDSLRQRFGGKAGEIRGDLDLLEQEQQQQEEAADIEKRRAALEEREAQERQRQLETLDRPVEPDRGASPPAIEAEPSPAPVSPPTRTPPARVREAAAPTPAAPPPLNVPPPP